MFLVKKEKNICCPKSSDTSNQKRKISSQTFFGQIFPVPAAMVATLPPQRGRPRLRRRGGGGRVSAGGLEELQRAEEVPPEAAVGHRHPEELEAPLSPQVFGGRDGPGRLERVQGEEPLLPDAQERDAAAGDEQGIPGSTQVRAQLLLRDHFASGIKQF